MHKKSDVTIAFINFEEYWDESNSYPMGILYISACLKRRGFTNIGYVDHVCMLRKMGEKTGQLFKFSPPETLLEQMSEERKHNLGHLLEYLKEFQPHIILLGPVTTFHLVELMDLMPRLREQFPQQLILAGGPHFGKDAGLDEELLENCRGLDGIVVGEAEETIVKVVMQFYSEYCKNNAIPSRVTFKSKLVEIAGIVVRGRGLKPRYPPRLDDLPSPDMELLEKHLKEPWEYANFRKYRLSNRRNPITWISRAIVDSDEGSGSIEDDIRYFDQFSSNDYRFPFGVIVGSRGCPYACSFCCSSGKRRVHSANYIFEQIVNLNERYGIRLFVFFDPLFTTSFRDEQKRVEDLCKTICDSGLDIKYMIDIRADIILSLPEELLGMMMQSGCIEFNLGLEKGSDRMLSKMMKGISIEDQYKAVTKLRKIAKNVKRRIIVNGTFILGGPEETKDDIRDTLIHCFRLNLDQATLYPLEICPGTKISAEAIRRGVMKPGLATYLNAKEYPLFATENLTRDFLLDIKRLSEQALDGLEELKKTMQEIERQFLLENKRDEFSSFDIKRTEKLHRLIERCIKQALGYVIKHPKKGLSRNGVIAPPIKAYVQKVNAEIDSLEKQLIHECPNYNACYWDYHFGTLSARWERFLREFEELFSIEHFLNE